jgi:hypothetical protein
VSYLPREIFLEGDITAKRAFTVCLAEMKEHRLVGVCANCLAEADQKTRDTVNAFKNITHGICEAHAEAMFATF